MEEDCGQEGADAGGSQGIGEMSPGPHAQGEGKPAHGTDRHPDPAVN
jgi:hypothetical protein